MEDCGAHLRAPEPATLYRMHGNLTGAYDIRHVAVRNRVVVTNKTPTGLNRGFGGPQVYFALERLVQRIAVELGLDPLDVIKRNLIPSAAFPYRTATGALLDSGDYQEAVARGVELGGLVELKGRRDAARARGNLYGIGYAAVVEPSVSNMGYITTVLTAAERSRAGPKNGAQATATVALDPVGGVTVHVASVPQGQGHRTVLSQVVADVFGIAPTDVRVNTELDTAKDAWSIASGNYASRFAPAVAGTVKLAAERLVARLSRVAASQLNTDPDDLVFVGGVVRSKRNPDNRLAFTRLAALGHWSPGSLPEDVGQTLRETVFWTPPQLTAPDEQDRVNSSLCHGFIFDFCGVEIDRTTLTTRIDRYVTMHDCGAILHPAMVDGQIRGGFAQALGAALYEEYAYAPDGSFLTGTFADYLLPTAVEVPDPIILHMQTPSPFTLLGSKGVARALHVYSGLHRERGGRCAGRDRCRIAARAGQIFGDHSRQGDRRPRELLRKRAKDWRRGSPSSRRGKRVGQRGARQGLGDVARSRHAEDRHSGLPSCREDRQFALPRRRDYRDRTGQGSLPSGGDAVRTRSAAGGDAWRSSGRRARIRRGRRADNACAERQRRHDGSLRLRRRHRRQDRDHRRSSPRWGGASRRRGVLCGPRSPRRQSREAVAPTVSAANRPDMVTVRDAVVKPAPFDYVRAETIDEALATLANEGGEAQIIAGGQSLMAMLNMRLAKPKTVVDIMRLKNLDRIEEKAGVVVVGAAVRQASLMGWPALPERLPLVALALPWTGHVQTRSRGTICGSIAHADPSAEMPLALITLGGEVHLRSARSRRRIAARDFFTGMMTTERADDELIEAVSFPVTPGRHCAFREVARRHGDFAIVACAAVATRDGVRLAVGGVADAPVARDWPCLDGSALDDALNAFAYDLDARDDIHATARYRRDLVRSIGRDLVREVCL